MDEWGREYNCHHYVYTTPINLIEIDCVWYNVCDIYQHSEHIEASQDHVQTVVVVVEALSNVWWWYRSSSQPVYWLYTFDPGVQGSSRCQSDYCSIQNLNTHELILLIRSLEHKHFFFDSLIHWFTAGIHAILFLSFFLSLIKKLIVSTTHSSNQAIIDEKINTWCCPQGHVGSRGLIHSILIYSNYVWNIILEWWCKHPGDAWGRDWCRTECLEGWKWILFS